MIMFSNKYIKKIFQKLSINTENPLHELSILISYIMKQPVEKIIPFIYNYRLSLYKFFLFKILLFKRLKGYPIAYITHEKFFYGYRFFVNKHVLIPRDDTETLVEEVVKKIEIVYQQKKRVIICHEIGVGSGAVSISVAKECEKKKIPIKISCSDISPKALSVAKKNIIFYKMENTIILYFSRFYILENNTKKHQAIEKKMYDIIFSNPPYINASDYKNLSDGIRKYEPSLALKGGVDGDFYYRDILHSVKDHISKNGFILFEIGDNDQSRRVFLYLNNIFGNADIVNDLTGYARVCYAER